MEEKTTTKILAIRPGRREMGVAVLEGRDLTYWGVSGFRVSTEQALLTTVLTRVRRLISAYQPEVLALETPPPVRLQASPLLEPVVVALEILANEEALAFRSIEPAKVRKRLCGSVKATHEDIAKRLVLEYPHLERYRNCGNSWKDAYWQSMFTAAAVALVYSQDLFPMPPVPRSAECATSAAP